MNGRQEEDPLQQRGGSSLKQNEPQLPHVKEEEEEVWISQEGECVLGQEDADLTKFPLTGVSVKTEDHKDKPPESSQLHHSPKVCEKHILPEQHEWIFRMEQEEPQPSHFKEEDEASQTPHVKKEVEDPLTPHLKEEEGEHSISQEGENLEWLEEFPVTGVIVKSEDDEVKDESEEKRVVEPPSSSSTQHMTTEADGDHCGGSQADKLLAPLPDSKDTTSHSPDTEDEDTKADKTCHTDNTRLKCSYCDKTYKYHCRLKVHTRIHTGEKPFSCSECGKGFITGQYLKVHMKIHIGEKPFSCSVCGKGFTQRHGLKSHTRIHTGEKPFSCTICGKDFVQNQHLKVHMRIHTGEKPYSCSSCTKSFCDQSRLVVHMRTHTGKMVYSCSVCDERFSYKYECKKHKCAGENSSSK
ncbi:uncharacterized protein [Nerophis lumbriciformis]|uniref:uncharacterized protein n=1 Tax=Nerophis lumbriciformis TaxID=546530 RepID=UPI002ADFCCE2|nr:zinc finger and SCAN domain-containing protein 31-like [Nerophis lumbriciformis]XP_061838682.1 zinc finger and SCAN domain-containing protein 31-like [Nerophis lumbriciformis]